MRFLYLLDCRCSTVQLHISRDSRLETTYSYTVQRYVQGPELHLPYRLQYPTTRFSVTVRYILIQESEDYRGGEKGPQGSGIKTVSTCAAWTHRGVERYPDVLPCFRRYLKHTPKHQFWTQNGFVGPGCLIRKLGVKLKKIHGKPREIEWRSF